MEKTKRDHRTDMTSGSPARLIFFFSLPLLAGNVFQQLYNMVDSIVVGRFVGHTALAAVGTAFPVIFLLSSLFMGLGTGAMIMVSQYYGANDGERLVATVNTIYSALMAGIVPISLAGIFLCRPIMDLMAVPADTYDECWIYMVIVLGGLVGTLGYNVNAGILQGLGDSRTPLLFLTIACAINIALDLVFVIVFHMGVAGVAIATVAAQVSSWIFGIFYINRKYSALHIRPFYFGGFRRDLFKQLVRLGIPAGIQQALFSVGIMAQQRLVNSYGSAFIAGFNGANKLDTFAFMPIQSFSMAVTTYVGQNIGAGRPERVRRGAGAAMAMGIAFSLAATVFLLLEGDACMRLFSAEEPVIAAGVAYLDRIMPFYWMLAILFVLNGVMRGAGEMRIPMVNSILSLWLARLPAAYLFTYFFGPENMYFCYAAGWAVGLAVAVPYFLSGRWKDKSIVVRRPAPEKTEN